MKKVAVIGGGASGIISAVEISSNIENVEVTVFERLPKICKKILVTGNGRCNFTNTDLSPKHFYGNHNFLRTVLTSVYADSENYFRSSGLLSYIEDGRIYPRSQQSSSVRDILLNLVEKHDIKCKTETPVTKIRKKGTGFLVNEDFFDAVVISGGGKAAPVQGSDGSCFKILKDLGHTVTPLYPALCGLVSSDKNIHTLKGVRTQAKASLYSGNTLLGEESGEVQFAEKSVSGIPVMNLSHLCKSNKNLVLKLDLCEELSLKELDEHFSFIKNTNGETLTETALGGICNVKLGYVIIKKSGIPQSTKLNNLTEKDINNIITNLKCLEIPIDSTKDFTSAQVTCGGIDTNEVNPETMMSRIIPGLFICGEILDIHGDCGGYNLHLAWTTGRIAGNGVATYLEG